MTTQLALGGVGRDGATFSPCGTYRYLLWRTWGSAPPLGFVMLNPSTADARLDDPTIRRCIGFAQREHAGGVIVANVYAYRATDPAELDTASAAGVDVVGPDSDQALVDLRRACPRVVVAWGAHPIPRARIETVARTLIHSEIVCLDTTKDGHPRHPLYVRADAPFVSWSVS